jgi:thymidylate kinase
MPIIILEGIDGSGKSTLAQRLLAASPIETFIEHRGPIKGSVRDEYFEPLLKLRYDQLLITDRWHVGEMIYGPIYRGVSLVRPVVGELETMLDKLNAVRLILSPPLETVLDRLRERGEDYLQPEHVEPVYKFYEAYARVFNYNVLETIPDDKTVEDLVNQAVYGRTFEVSDAAN